MLTWSRYWHWHKFTDTTILGGVTVLLRTSHTCRQSLFVRRVLEIVTKPFHQQMTHIIWRGSWGAVGEDRGALLLCSCTKHLGGFVRWYVCTLGAYFIVAFSCTLSLKLTRWPRWWGLDLVEWLCEACNSAQVCLAIFILRSLHQRGACKVWLFHTHTTCRRVIVPLSSKGHTQCDWQHHVCDAAGTFATYYNWSIWFMKGM